MNPYIYAECTECNAMFWRLKTTKTRRIHRTGRSCELKSDQGVKIKIFVEKCLCAFHGNSGVWLHKYMKTGKLFNSVAEDFSFHKL